MTVTPLLKKLNFKQQKEILILNYPAEFEVELDAIKDCTTIKTMTRTKDFAMIEEGKAKTKPADS